MIDELKRFDGHDHDHEPMFDDQRRQIGTTDCSICGVSCEDSIRDILTAADCESPELGEHIRGMFQEKGWRD